MPASGGTLLSKVRVIIAVAAALTSVACGRRDNPNEVRFWALGREGEVVKEMVHDFEKEHPGITVRVQQIPWSAAHEKLLTAHVGDVTPDVAQIGNTWVPEFVALHALEPLSPHIANSKTVAAGEYFPGIWETNVLADTVWGVPWYVDTRLMYYRKDLLEKAGWKTPPTTWNDWRAAMEKIRSTATRGAEGEQNWSAFIPTNEWNLPIILGLQSGSTLLRDGDGRGAFKDPNFRRAFEYFVGLYRDGLAPKFGSNDVANLYQEFAKGRFVFYVSGPWQIGEFKRRLPAEMQGSWATAVMPGPEVGVPGVSLAGGASLVVFKKSNQKNAAWQLVEFLSRPEQQVKFYELTGDLPARTAAWKAPRLANDTLSQAFYTQLLHVLPTPKVPEWELIAQRVIDHAETVVRGNTSVDDALQALDRDVDNILEKRRWLQSQQAKPVNNRPVGTGAVTRQPVIQVGAGVTTRQTPVGVGSVTRQTPAPVAPGGSTYQTPAPVGVGVATRQTSAPVGAGVATHQTPTPVGVGVATRHTPVPIAAGVTSHQTPAPVGVGIAARQISVPLGAGATIRRAPIASRQP